MAVPEDPPSMHSPISPPSLPRSSTAPRSTVIESEETNRDEECTPYFPRGNKSALGGGDTCSPAPVVLSEENDSDKPKGRREPATVSTVTEPGVFVRRNAQIEVEAGSAVQWVRHGAGDSAIPHTDNAKTVFGRGEESWHDSQKGSQPTSRAGDNGLFVTVIAEDTDEPPVTRQVPGGGVCFHDLFDRPGRYTYYVCSSSVITGCIISKVTTSQPRMVEPSTTTFPAMPSTSVVSDDGSASHTSPTGMRIPEMATVRSDEGTSSVEGLVSSLENKQLRQQQECKKDESQGRGYESDESLGTLLVPPVALVKSRTVHLQMPLNGTTCKRIPDDKIHAGGDQVCVGEAGETTESSEIITASPEPPSQKTVQYLTLTEEGTSGPISVALKSKANGVAYTCVEDIHNISGLPGRSPKSVVPPVPKVAYPEASSQNTASPPPPESYAAPGSIAVLEESNPAAGNDVGLDGAAAAAENPEQGGEGILPTVADTMSNAGSSKVDMVNSKPLDDNNAPKAISVLGERDATGQGTAYYNVVGLVTSSQGHGHDGDGFTLSKVSNENSATADPVDSTQVDRVAFVQSQMTGPSPVASAASPDTMLFTEAGADAIKSLGEVHDIVRSTRLGLEIAGSSSAMMPPQRATSVSDIELSSTAGKCCALKVNSTVDEKTIGSAPGKNVKEGVAVIGSPGRGYVNDRQSVTGTASMIDKWESGKAELPSKEQVSAFESISAVKKGKNSRAIEGKLSADFRLATAIVSLRSDMVSSPSLPSSSTAPRSTVIESEFTRYSPGGDKSALGGGDTCSPAPVVLSEENDSDKPKGRREPATVSAVIEPGVFVRRNAQIEVEAGSAVQWVRHGAGDSAIPRTDNAKTVFGRGEESWHDSQKGSQPTSRTGDNGLFVTVIAEDTDEPPVTRQVPGGGVCFHDLFDRPGRYTYYVCSSSVITGCIISKATTSQPRMVEPSTTTFPAIPSTSVVSDDGSASHTSPTGMRIPEMATVWSDEGTSSVEGLVSSLENKQLRQQQECKTGDSGGRGYENGKPQVDQAGFAQRDTTTTTPVATADTADGRVTPTDAEVGGDAMFANEANKTDMLTAQIPKSVEQASSITSSQRLQSATASHFQEADHGPPTYDRTGAKFPAPGAIEKISLVSELAAGENVAQGTDNFLLSRLSQPVVPSDDSEAFFVQDCGNGGGGGGGEPSSVDSDDVPIESWIKGSAYSDNSVIGKARQPSTVQSPLVRSPSVPIAITIPNEEGRGMPSVSKDIIAEVMVRSSLSPREEPDLRHGVDGIQGEPGRELEGASPLKIGGTDTMSSRRSVDNDGTPRDKSPKATVYGGDAEENVGTSSQEEVEPAMSGTKLRRMMLTSEDLRDKSDEESSGKTENTHESASVTSTAFIGCVENAEGLEKGDGPATAAPSTCDLPSSFPRSTSEDSIPPERNNKGYAFESKEAPHHASKKLSEKSSKHLDFGSDDSDNVHIVTISDDSTQPFDPEVLRVPRGARVTWRRPDCEIGDKTEPEAFVLRLRCPIIETGWRLLQSFSLSSAQPAFTFKFDVDGRFVVSNDGPPGLEKKRGEVEVEGASGECGSSDSFATSEDSGTWSKRSKTNISPTTSYDIKGDNERATDVDGFEKPSTPTKELGYGFKEEKRKSTVDFDTAASIPHDEAGGGRCNDIDSASDPPASASPVLSRARTSTVAVSRGKHFDLDTGAATRKRQGEGKAYTDGRSNATGSTQGVGGQQEAAVATTVLPRKEEKDRSLPTKCPKSKKGNSKKKKEVFASGAENGGENGRVVSRRDGSSSVVKHGAAVMLGEKGTYARKFGDCALSKEPVKTLLVSDRGFKPAKHLILEVESIVSIKTASDCTRAGNEHQSIYVVGPIAQKNRRSHDGLKKKDLERTPTHAITSEVPLEVVLMKPGEYWLVENFSCKRIRVTATPRELPEIPGSDCEQHTAHSTQYAASLSAGTSSTEKTKENTDCAEGDVTFSCSKNEKEGKGKARAAAAPFSETTSTSAAKATVTVQEAAVSTSARYADRTSYDGPQEQAREGTSSKHSSRLPPVRVMGEGKRISGDEYDSFNARFAAAVVQISHPKGFALPKLQLGFAPGLGTLVVCELGARQRVTREVVCRYIACESTNREAMTQRSKRGKESTPAAKEGSTAREAPRDINANSRVKMDEDNMASVRLGPGTLSVCSFILGRFGSYRLSFRNDVSAGLTVVVCPPRNVPSPMSSVDAPSIEWPTSSEAMKEGHTGSKSRPQKGRQGWWSGERARNGTGKRLSQQISRGGRGMDSLTRVCGRDGTVLLSSWQPSVDTRASVKAPATKPLTQGQQKSGTTKGPGSKVKADSVSWSKVAAAYGKQPPVQSSSIQRRLQAQHDGKSQVVKKQKSNEIGTSSTCAILGEAILGEKAKKTLAVEENSDQVATCTAPVASTKALKVPSAKMHQDDVRASCGSTKWTPHTRKVCASTEGLQINSTENLATATEEVSSAAVGAASKPGGPSDTTKFPVGASASQERCSTLRKTRDESRRPRIKSKLSAATPSEDRRSGESKLGAVTQSDNGQITVSASEKLVDDSTAIGSTITTSQEEEPTGWPTPIEGASWSEGGVKPMACPGDDLQVERCGRSGTMSDIPTTNGRESAGVQSSSIDESCSKRGGPGYPRSRRPRSSPLNSGPEKWVTPPEVTVSRCQPWSPPDSESIQAQREPGKVDTMGPACSGWGPVSPSASSENGRGWPSVPSAQASVKPIASPCSVTKPVGSGARKTTEPLHACKERQKESTPYQAPGKRTAVPASSRTSKGLMSAADSMSSTSLKKTIGKKDKAPPAVKAAVTITSDHNAPNPPLSEGTGWSSSSESTVEGTHRRGALGQRLTDKQCSPDIDPQISFGDFVPPGKESTSLTAKTATAPSPEQGGKPLSPSTDLCGWTTTVEDCDRTKGLGKTMSKLEGGGGSFGEEFKNSNGVVRSVSKGGLGEDATTSASAGEISFLPVDSGEKPLRSSSGVQPAVKDVNKALVGVTAFDCLANPKPVTTASAAGGTVSTCRVASTRRSTDPKGPRWGNYSTKISLAERVRRCKQLNGICLPQGYRPDEPVKSRPAAFPEASRWRNGDDLIPKDERGTLPPPSEYEKAETAIMMKMYDDVMERLRTSGYDKKLPNGHRPKIYDLTGRCEI